MAADPLELARKLILLRQAADSDDVDPKAHQAWSRFSYLHAETICNALLSTRAGERGEEDNSLSPRAAPSDEHRLSLRAAIKDARDYENQDRSGGRGVLCQCAFLTRGGIKRLADAAEAYQKATGGDTRGEANPNASQPARAGEREPVIEEMARIIYEHDPYYESGEYVEGHAVSPGGYLSWERAKARDAEFGDDPIFTKLTEWPYKVARALASPTTVGRPAYLDRIEALEKALGAIRELTNGPSFRMSDRICSAVDAALSPPPVHGEGDN